MVELEVKKLFQQMNELLLLKNEQILRQNEQIMQLSQTKTAQEGCFSIYEGGTDEMSRKLKYGQGSVIKRIRLSYIDEYNRRQIKTVGNTKIAQHISSRYKCNIYVFYVIKWFDEYGTRQTRTVSGNQPNGKPVNK